MIKMDMKTESEIGAMLSGLLCRGPADLASALVPLRTDRDNLYFGCGRAIVSVAIQETRPNVKEMRQPPSVPQTRTRPIAPT